METFSNFRKLWGRIDHDLKPDNYTIIINNSKIYIIKNMTYINIMQKNL